jgi:hypothetical protein
LQTTGDPLLHVPLLQVLPVVQGLPSLQASPLPLATHAPVLASQVWQTGQDGLQTQEPQLTLWPQLLVTLPHWPAQVCSWDSGTQQAPLLR